MPANAGIHAFLATRMNRIETTLAQPNRIHDTTNRNLTSPPIRSKLVIASASEATQTFTLRIWNFRVFIAGLSLMFTAATAAAQPISNPLPKTYKKPSVCQNYTLTGPEFMGLIKLVINHGDLTDISFIEKTFDTKFSQSYFGVTPDGKTDIQDVFYHSDRLLNDPITVALWINDLRTRQLDFNQIALLSMDQKIFPDSDKNFLSSCLHISIASFYQFFGNHFMGGVINGRGAAGSQISSAGNRRSTFSLNVGYSPDDNIVNHIGIDQRQ